MIQAGMVESVEFAKYIISRVKTRNETGKPPIELGGTKLQKLIYICDGCLLALGENLIGENARAWKYGPVYPKVNTWLSKNPGIEDIGEPCSPETLSRIESIEAAVLIDKIIEEYGSRTAQALSAWTHEDGSPWKKALEAGQGKMNSPIDKNDMRDYFAHTLLEVPADEMPPLTRQRKEELAAILEEAGARGEIDLSEYR
jgi:uncharacterized phage-associated protein